jgi:hypothetical protein
VQVEDFNVREGGGLPINGSHIREPNVPQGLPSLMKKINLNRGSSEEAFLIEGLDNFLPALLKQCPFPYHL